MNMQAPDFNHTALAASPCLVLAGCSSSDSPSTTTQDDPTLGADDPTTPSTGNPYSPLVPGTTSRLEGQDEDGGVETVVTTVSHETHIVNGVVRSIVVDHEYKNSELVEEAFDFFAQDDDGNVWYLGETVDDYEYDDNSELVEINNDGVWESGVDGAQPGITMPAEPRVGDSYRQEYLPDEAEDIAAVVTLDITVELRDSATYQTLKTRDWNPLDSEARAEYKYYAQGMGLVHEEDEEDEEGEEQADLVSHMQS